MQNLASGEAWGRAVSAGCLLSRGFRHTQRTEADLHTSCSQKRGYAVTIVNIHAPECEPEHRRHCAWGQGFIPAPRLMGNPVQIPRPTTQPSFLSAEVSLHLSCSFRAKTGGTSTDSRPRLVEADGALNPRLCSRPGAVGMRQHVTTVPKPKGIKSSAVCSPGGGYSGDHVLLLVRQSLRSGSDL